MGTICQTDEDVSPGTAFSQVILCCRLEVKVFSHVFIYGGNTNSTVDIKNINNRSLIVAVTKQTITRM